MLESVKNFIIDFWATLAAMSPYLLLGFFVAGLLSVFISAAFVERHLGNRGRFDVWGVIKASLLGVPLPLCSCGVIPVTVSLRKHGASRGSAISFLLSTPQTGIDSFFVTFSLLGPVYAIFRPIIAFVTGLVGGFGVQIVTASEHVEGAQKHQEPKCEDSCCCEGKQKVSVFKRIFKHGFITLPRDIAKPMLVGLVIAALISTLVPDDFFADKLGTGIGTMVIMMFLGIPVYVCATASVPVAAAMILKGLSPGAALVFLMTGPATNIAAFATIWKSMGTKTAIVYILTVAVCALAAGILMDAIYPGLNTTVKMQMEHVHGGPLIVDHVAGVALLLLLGYGLVSKKLSAIAAAKKNLSQSNSCFSLA